MKRASIFVLILLISSAGLHGGDIAQFSNLGFSEDSSIFVFGQFGIHRDSSLPFASLYFVDVEKNDFLNSGVYSSSESQAVSLGQNGSGALYNLLHQASSLIRQHKISHTRQGRLVYLYVNGDSPKSRITFRDFNTGTTYDIQLVQEARGSGETQSAAFHLLVSATSREGQVRTYTVGIPDYFRSGVSRYVMKQVVLSPDERSIVMVVEKVSDLPSGKSLEYMVETVRVF